jgi:hypothetical protein
MRDRVLILGGGLLLGVLLAAGLAQLRPGGGGSESADSGAPAPPPGPVPVAGAAREAGEPPSEPGFFERVFRREPETRAVPAGTLLSVRFLDTLSSHASSAGETFRAEVAQEVSSGGRGVIPAGTRVLGTVADAHPARKIGGRPILSLRFHTLQLPSGDVAISAAFASAGRSQAPQDAAIIGGSTLGGAILGEALHEGEGGVVGAVVGGIAGAIGAKRTQGRPLVVPAGTVMAIELTDPVTVTLG